MKDLNELRRRRGAIIKDMRALTDKADAEKRELTAEESDQYSRMEVDQEKLRVEIEREERQQKLDRELESFDREPGRMPAARGFHGQPERDRHRPGCLDRQRDDIDPRRWPDQREVRA